ncbi:MAG: TadE family type IV pilus minor pilin [Aeromicrobium sp.]|uniref:TadE family type IV pilus minor pilin n=1 Tax=Aeromicrobium sp. TaxID=1871063 RepID=UPI0039E2BA75
MASVMASRRRRECGMATAELATIAPVGVALAVLLLWAVSLGYTQIRLTDAAREAARMVARGDSVAAAERVAREQAPADAVVEIDSDDGLVEVTISVTSSLPGDWFDGPLDRELTASAVAAAEAP